MTVTTTSGARFEGLLAGAGTKDELAVTLKHAVALDEPDAPGRRALTIFGRDLAAISASGIDLDARTDVKAPVAGATPSGSDTFRTDTDISGAASGPAGEGRTLQQWSGGAAPAVDARMSGALEAGGKSGSWDQFATNERLYGVKTNFDEDLYTTKLDRSGKDFRERERKANQIAQEILSGGTTNAHVAEERNQATAHEGDEEDRCVLDRSSSADAQLRRRHSRSWRLRPAGRPCGGGQADSQRPGAGRFTRCVSVARTAGAADRHSDGRRTGCHQRRLARSERLGVALRFDALAAETTRRRASCRRSETR